VYFGFLPDFVVVFRTIPKTLADTKGLISGISQRN
jgi:hypothetical protein